jgi:hypothetical protein
MRLLNVDTMKMEEFFDGTVPPYVILSHRWGPEEVSFQEWNRVLELEDKIHSITRQSAFHTARHANDYHHEIQREKYRKLAEKKAAIRQKAGFSKILSCAGLVRKQKSRTEGEQTLCSYVWIDTCCIDKTNNAELSEAINSMFRWYRNSKLCLVYLADVPGGLELNEMEDKVRASNWFKRGWTLQELLAPEFVKFFDQSWEFLFNKYDQARLLAEITCIDENILDGFEKVSDACTAKKMSWAASRETTRKEDIAYCLLGIFDVNIPLLYGEGDKAFLRLQEEIIRQSGDLSIFAWGYHNPVVYQNHSIFAQSPADFVGCSGFTKGNAPPAVISMTNVTLSVQLSYYRPRSDRLSFIYADLNCFDYNGTLENLVFLPLVLIGNQLGSNANDISSLSFERPAGARPLPINDENTITWNPDEHWIYETRTIYIFKKCFERHPKPREFMLASYSAVVDEVYPPHFWGQVGTTLDFGGMHKGNLWYPGAVEAKAKTDSHEYDTVAYIRVSHGRNRRCQMVIIVRCSEHWNTEVRLSEWPNTERVSLADFEFNQNLHSEGMGGIASFEPGVEGTLFGGFHITHYDMTIAIIPSGPFQLVTKRL